MKKIVLKKDYIIPAGTEFKCIDGRTTEYKNGNYSTLIAVNKNSTAEFVIDDDVIESNLFEFIDAD